jgi:hypothetical protein
MNLYVRATRQKTISTSNFYKAAEAATHAEWSKGVGENVE